MRQREAVLRVHSGNIRRIPYDLQAGARTIANLIGFERAKTLYLGLLGALYLSLTPLAFSQAGPGVLLALLSLPVALYQYRLLQRLKGPLDPAATDLRRSSTYLDLSFGLLYTLGVIFSI